MYLYKYYPFKSYALDNLEKEEVCFNNVSIFNDNEEGKYYMASNVEYPKEYKDLGENIAKLISENATNLIIFKNRISCFTYSNTNEHMWKIYSDNSKGFCIEYKLDDIKNIEGINKIGNINYNKSNKPRRYLEDELSDTEFLKDVERIFFSKEEVWKEEQEVRVLIELERSYFLSISEKEYLDNEDNKDKYYYYYKHPLPIEYLKSPRYVPKKCKLNKVYLGKNMSDDNKKRIMGILSDHSYEFEQM